MTEALHTDTLPPPGLDAATEPRAGEVVEDEALEDDAVDNLERKKNDVADEDVDEEAET